jgi:hypothetical protein
LDLVADENADAPIIAALRAAGHQIVYVQELDPGIDDAGFSPSQTAAAPFC